MAIRPQPKGVFVNRLVFHCAGEGSAYSRHSRGTLHRKARELTAGESPNGTKTGDKKMARRNREVGFVKSCVLASALIAGLALPGQADDKKLTLSATTYVATDYMFRGISNTNQHPEATAEFDVLYGIFYAGMWGSNTAYGDNIEIDYYAGLTPNWGNVTFNFAALWYSYPGSPGGIETFDVSYLELKAAAAYTTGQWTFGIGDWWSPDNFQVFGESNAIEGSVAYAFKGKLFNFFSPTVSGILGFQSYEDVASDYTYWNAGLTLGFMDHYSFDIRYWDTDYSKTECSINSANADSNGFNNCDARAVGTLKAVF